ncbi:MAG: hypothetical protein WC969_03670 [Elusimicrobiota bacterium]|jgi:hypothetical protein
MLRTLALLVLAPNPLCAQTRAVPIVTTALPVVSIPVLAPTPSLAFPGMLAPLPGLNLQPALVRAAASPALLPSSVKSPAAAQALPAKTVVEMKAFGAALEAGRSEPVALEKGLSAAYEGSAQKSASPLVEAAAPAPVPSGLLPALRSLSLARRSVEEPAPPAGPSGWRKLLAAGKKAGAVLLGLYGGMKLGDIAYSLLVHRMPLAGGLLATAGIAAGVLWLRRTRASSGRGPLMPSLMGTIAGVILGNLVWTLAGSAVLGLGAGAAIGLAAGLYAGGVLFPDKK